jgi:uroporphyrinogen decarboxylase
MGFLSFPIRKPQPNVDYFLDILFRRKEPSRTIFVEYLIDEPVKKRTVEEVLGGEWVPWGPDRKQQAKYLDNLIEIFFRLGYDVIRFEYGPSFLGEHCGAKLEGGRGWLSDYESSIASWEDFDKYPWPQKEDLDLWPYEYISKHMPGGMGLIASFPGGLFESLRGLMGFEKLSLALYRDPDLLEAVSQRVGQIMQGFYDQLMGLPRLVGFLQGDDFGYRKGLLVSPNVLRKHILPWHKKFSDLCHSNGLFYCLHSCGNVEEIMEDLIEEVRIDGKHSFEDAIMPVWEFKRKYGNRIAVLGGVDVDKLSRAAEPELRNYVQKILRECVPRGSYALGSGNSIADYIPMENYLIMLDEGMKWSK